MEKEGSGINLGQVSVQFLPLSELFVSAAESFIIMGSWCAKGKAWILSDRAVNVKRWSWVNHDEKPWLYLVFVLFFKYLGLNGSFIWQNIVLER